MSIAAGLNEREALEQFQAQYPAAGSIRSIVEISRDAFVQTYAIAFAGGVEQAQKVYQFAFSLNEKAVLMWANVKDTAASPFFQATLFNNIPTDFINHQQSIPGYDRLFDQRVAVECEECQSILSPAAYFVDLMRFVKANILQKNSNLPDGCRLQDRRPDLWTMQLDCDNTNQMILSVDLVNEVLEQFNIDSNSPQADLYADMAEAKFPMSLPFNLPLQEVRSYLQPFKTSLDQIYQVFSPLPPVTATCLSETAPASSAIDALRVQEQLALSPADMALLTAEAFSAATLAEIYRSENLSEQNLAGLDRVSQFLDRTGLTRRQLDELLFQDLDRSEVTLGWMQTFFINADDLPPLAIAPADPANSTEEKLLNLTLPRLDRIYRFLKLSRQLGWSFADLDGALRSLQSVDLPELVLRLDGDGDYVACRDVQSLNLSSFTLEAQICPLRSGMNPILFKGSDRTLHFLLYLDETNFLRLKTAQYEVQSVDRIALGEFSQVIVTIAADRVEFNGKPGVLKIGEAIRAITPAGSELNIGKDGQDACFNGFIKSVRIWDGVQDVASIAQRQVSEPTNGLVADWPLDPNQGIWADDRFVFLDTSANQNHGRLFRLSFMRSDVSSEGDSPFVAAPNLTERVLLSTDFGAEPNLHPQDWVDTADYFKTDAIEAFSTFDLAGSMVFGTQSTANHLHSHYTGSGSSSWSNYRYTGRLQASSTDAGIGVTILSGYPNTPQYYRLRSMKDKPFELVFRDATNQHLLAERPIGTLPILQGTLSSDVRLTANVWFRFAIEVETESRTQIRAKIWPEGEAEPAQWQIDAFDDAPDRLRQGTIGVWTLGGGSKAFDDLQVVQLMPSHRRAIALNVKSLSDLAAIKQLQTASNLPIDRLTALWHSPKYTGKNDDRTLFDQTFNPTGITQSRLSYPLDRPLRWMKIGSEINPNRDRQVRTRLLSALRISSDDLNRLVQWMQGEKAAIAIDTADLTFLYQLVETARLLQLGIAEFLSLLDYLNLRKVISLPLILTLQVQIRSLQQAGFSIAEFLLRQAGDDRSIAPTEAAIRSLATTFQSQARELADGSVQAEAILLSSLTTLFAVPAEVMQAVIDFLRPTLTAEQLVALFPQDEQPIPVPLRHYFSSVARLLHPIQKFKLTASEAKGLLNHPASFGVTQFPSSSIADLSRLMQFKQLQAAFQDSSDRLLELLQLPADVDAAILIDRIVALTQWEPQQLTTLINFFGRTSLSRVEWLSRLQAAMQLSQAIGVNIAFLIQLANPDLSIATYRRHAANLLKVLRATYLDDRQWETIYKPIRDQLALQKRDALLNVALTKIGVNFSGRRDANLLYEFLLIDPQISSEVQTSRIGQAIASVQLYIQRCLLNLEAGIDPTTIAIEQWEWMKNYRVWEANRKVFLYPENYIEPELRRTKTPLFAELQQELMQGEMTQELVEKVYKNYLDKFQDVADLKIVGSYLYRDRVSDPIDRRDVLYLIGCTKTQPRLFYYRTFTVQMEQWTPWTKIELGLNTEWVTPIFGFNRLFLFWVEFVKSKKAVPFLYDEIRDADEVKAGRKGKRPANKEIDGNFFSDRGKLVEKTDLSKVEILISTSVGEPMIDAIDVYKPVIKFSFYNFGKTWIAPQTYLELPNELSEFESFSLRWQRVYAQSALELSQAVAGIADITAIDRTEKAKALQVDARTNITTRLDAIDMTKLTWAAWINPALVEMTTPNQDDAITRITLFDYDNGALKVTVTNAATPISQNINSIIPRQIRVAIQMAQMAVDSLRQLIPQLDTDMGRLRGLFSGNTDQAENTLEEVSPLLYRPEAAQLPEPVRDAFGQACSRLNTAINSLTGARDTMSSGDRQGLDSQLQNAQNRVNEAREFVIQAENMGDVTGYRPTEIKLQVQMGSSIAEWSLATGWQYMALHFDYWHDRQGYNVTLFREDNYRISLILPLSQQGTARTSEFFSSAILPARKSLTIAKHPTNVTPAITLQLSDFCLLRRLPGIDELEKIRYRRKAASEVAFYLPLNRSLTWAFINLVDSSLLFAAAPVEIKEPDRERLILFYGDLIKTLRNNLTEDKAFNLTFKPSETAKNYDLDLSLERLHIALTNGLSINDYATGRNKEESQRLLPDAVRNLMRVDGTMPSQLNDWMQDQVNSSDREFNRQNSLLTNLPRLETDLADVGNQPGWYIFGTGDDQYLLRAILPDLKTTQERIRLRYEARSSAAALQSVSIDFDPDARLKATLASDATTYTSPGFKLAFDRLNTFAINHLSETLLMGGVDALLSLESQNTPERGLDRYSPNLNLAAIDRVTEKLDFNGANGLYYWEIFFHIPFLIANQLNANQKFAEAQKWYHYLFNPTAQEATNPASDRYWRFLPFRSERLETLADMLSNPRALAEYREDPGDPHAIARLRANAYQKAIVMKYIDNLLDWGDKLFEKDDRESINEAAMLYVLSYSLLGPKPDLKPAEKFVEVGTYWHLEKQYGEADIPEFLIGEGDRPANTDRISTGSAFNPHNTLATSFCTPENQQFAKYWDRVEDRLYKIRHSLSLEGIFRQLALFSAPIDPAVLAQALAQSGSLGSALADQAIEVPYFRFALMMEKTKEMVATTIDLGDKILSALQSQDSEALAVLQNIQEKRILDLTTAVKQAERNAAQTELEALELSKKIIDAKIGFWSARLVLGLPIAEGVQIAMLTTAAGLKIAQVPLRIIGSGFALFPDIELGASGAGGSPRLSAQTKGGAFKDFLGETCEGLEASAGALETGAEIVNKTAEAVRNFAELVQEVALARLELDEVNKKIEVAQIQILKADAEMIVHKQEIEHQQQVAEFYRSKYTNQELYSWMSSRLSTLYFQAYNLAYNLAKSTEKALQFELPTTEKFISYGHWDNRRKGLLAGESLLIDLHRMEKFNLDKDRRWLSIEKQISLQQAAKFPKQMPKLSAALEQLKDTGVCDFALTEELFNRDYYGHYCRQIKTIGIAIHLEAGALESSYDGIHATLTQVSNQLLLQPDLEGVKYLMNVDGASRPDNKILREDWRSHQQIAISKVGPGADVGIFNLDFVFDTAYFPFENTGAVSKWQLELPIATNPRLKFDRITDVVIHLRYVAQTQGDPFKANVSQLMKNL